MFKPLDNGYEECQHDISPSYRPLEGWCLHTPPWVKTESLVHHLWFLNVTLEPDTVESLSHSTSTYFEFEAII